MKRVYNLDDAKKHFYGNDKSIVCEKENGAKLCESIADAERFYERDKYRSREK